MTTFDGTLVFCELDLCLLTCAAKQMHPVTNSVDSSIAARHMRKDVVCLQAFCDF